MTDGIRTGLEHTLWALGYLLGAAPIITAAALLAALLIAADIPHRARVHRIRRHTRRTGRLAADQAADRAFIRGVAP